MDVNRCRCLSQVLGLCQWCFTGCSGPHPQMPPSSSATPVETLTEAPVDPPPANLTLGYKVGQADTYCLSSEATRSVKFEGVRPDDMSLDAFDSAITERLSDITRTREPIRSTCIANHWRYIGLSWTLQP